MLSSLHVPLLILLVVLLSPLTTEWGLGQKGVRSTGGADRAAASRPRQGPEEQPREKLELPLLLGLSREIARLRRSVDFVGEVRLSSGPTGAAARPRRLPLVHLGSGFLAGPRDPELEPGTTGLLRFRGSLYRVRYLGVDRNFAGYYRLRDRNHMKPLPVPHFSAPAERRKLGDLVLVLEGSSARLRLLSSWRFSLPPISNQTEPGSSSSGDHTARSKPKGKSEGERLGSWRSIQFHKLSEGKVAEAAVVLALDGALVGLVCSPGAVRGQEAASPVRDLQIVVDGRFLLRQALGIAASLEVTSAKLPAPAPALGVMLAPAGQQKADAKGFLVQELVLGAPGYRAGVKVGDRWLEIDGQVLESFTQIRAILEKLEAGKKLEIRFLRAGAKADTLWIQPD